MQKKEKDTCDNSEEKGRLINYIKMFYKNPTLFVSYCSSKSGGYYGKGRVA